MSAFRLRDAGPADAAAIAALHAANWRSAYAEVLDSGYLKSKVDADRLAVWSERLDTPASDQEVIVAETGEGTLVGFVCLYHDGHPRWGGFVDNLHSASAVRGAGVGKMLLRHAASRIAARDPEVGLWLWVFEKNLPARGFYAALGGTIVERVPSDWAAALGEMRLRCHWPSAAELVGPRSS